MPKPSRRALTLPAFLCLTISLAGCVTDGAPPVARQLPPAADVVLDPVKPPLIRPGDDARVAWKKEEAARAEANKRLVKSREIYTDVRQTYSSQ